MSAKTLSIETRRELGSFLRTHREGLRAADVGLVLREADRRRTPGLRREEVALLCGLSSTWYSWIEQGRDVAASASALARVADVLRLNRAERAYLFELARRQDPKPDPVSNIEDMPPSMRQVLAATSVPAYGLDRLWRACGWNAAAGHLLQGWLQGAEPCLLGYVFLDPTARGFIVDWDERARRLVAEFRADMSRASDETDMKALASRLRRDSQEFDALWRAHAILGREGGRRLFQHPQDGRLAFDQVTLQVAGHERFRIVMLFPATGS